MSALSSNFLTYGVDVLGGGLSNKTEADEQGCNEDKDAKFAVPESWSWVDLHSVVCLIFNPTRLQTTSVLKA